MESISLTSIYIIIGLIFLAVVGYFWLFRIRKIINSYLDLVGNIVGGKPKVDFRLLPVYAKDEITGEYQGRKVIVGVQYVGAGFEWMPLPYIGIELRNVIRYNYSRVPDFALIRSGWLVFKIKERLVWGVFDKSYPRFFTKDFIIIALTRLMAVAEDVERGRTLGEIFK
jgi:hypothetical protein